MGESYFNCSDDSIWSNANEAKIDIPSLTHEAIYQINDGPVMVIGDMSHEASLTISVSPALNGNSFTFTDDNGNTFTLSTRKKNKDGDEKN